MKNLCNTQFVRIVAAVSIASLHLLLFGLFDVAMRQAHSSVQSMTPMYMIFVPPMPKNAMRSKELEVHAPLLRLQLDLPETILNVDTKPVFKPGLRLDLNGHEDATRAAREYLKNHPEQTRPIAALPLSPPSLIEQHSTPTNVREANGKLVEWISDKCYLQIRDADMNGVVAGFGGARIAKTCTGAPVTPRDDMFDHLKPEYLKEHN